MQQLTLSLLTDAMRLTGDSVVIALPLPSTPAQTTQFIDQFCALTGARHRHTDWGADRCAAHLTCADRLLVLYFEWVCEAVWLESDAGSHCSGQEIFDYFQHLNSSHNEQ